MYLEFHKKKTNYNCSISSWNGITILLDTGEVGLVDVMFKSICKNGYIRASVTKGTKVFLEGCTKKDKNFSSWFLENDKIEIVSIPYVIGTNLFSIDIKSINQGCLHLPSLLGYFYITKSNESFKCHGVDDPSLLKKLSFQYNEQLKNFLNTHVFNVNDIVQIYTEEYGISTVKITSKKATFIMVGCCIDTNKSITFSFNNILNTSWSF